MNLSWTHPRPPAGAALAVDRHEEKFLLAPAEAAQLRALLDGLLLRDRYSVNGPYYIRSLYFDTPDNTDYVDKVLGVSERRKLRLRLYDVAAQRLRLEEKQKSGVYSHKTGVWVSRQQAERLIAGEFGFLLDAGDAARRIYLPFARQLRRPAALIDYERTAWTLPVERVRITLDERVRAAKSSALFDPDVPMAGVHSGNAVVLEVKYDRFLPGYLRRVLSSVCAQGMSISKYAAARELLY